ncbi:MAG: hypothetical protein M0T77_00550 [Actinomycetota bacterium]|nr:hypothetical protein [Actinomycetota bacterium]
MSTSAPDPKIACESVTQEITVDAPLEEVWGAVSTDGGRELWLEDDPDRRIVLEHARSPDRVSWWWWNESDAEPARLVQIQLSPAPGGTRVTVTESQPAIRPAPELWLSNPSLACA